MNKQTRISLMMLPLLGSSAVWAAPPSGIDAGAVRGNMQIPATPSRPAKAVPVPGLGQANTDQVQPDVQMNTTFTSARIAGFTSDVEHDPVGPAQIIPLVGQNVTAAQWQTLSKQLWETYRAQGYLVRIDLVLDGKGSATVKVTQMRVHALKVSAAPGIDADDLSRFEQIVSQEIRPGDPVDLPGMEALIRRFYYRNDEVPRLDMSSFDRNSVDVALTLLPPPTPAIDKPWRVSVDNYGLNDLGRAQLTVGGQFSPAGDGDVLGITGLGSEGLLAGDVRYDLPAPGMLPLRFALDYNYLDYHVQNTAPGVGQTGYAQTARLEASYPQFFWGGGMLTHTLSYDNVRAADNVSDVNTAIKDMDNIRYRALALNFAGGRANGWLELTYGHLSLGGAVAPAEDVVAQTQGQYAKAYLEGSWNQPIVPWLSLDTRVRGQVSSKNLDSLEKFTLGGVSGVRAYDSDQARGDQGYAISLDLWAKPLENQAVRVGGFLDWGHVQSQRFPWLGSGPNNYDLNAGGVEAAYTYQALDLVVTAAHSLTQSSVVENSGWRVWAEANLHF